MGQRPLLEKAYKKATISNFAPFWAVQYTTNDDSAGWSGDRQVDPHLGSAGL